MAYAMLFPEQWVIPPAEGFAAGDEAHHRADDAGRRSRAGTKISLDQEWAHRNYLGRFARVF